MPARVLLLTPEFYGIEKTIKSALEKSGFEVIWFDNKTLQFDFHGKNSKFKVLRRICFSLLSPHKRYLRRELKKIENLKFDILFSINAQIICPFLFRKLKSLNPRLYSVLYLWDSFSMYNWTKELKLFDRVYTFDRADSIKYHINYKPNFYIKRDINTGQKNKYDLFFVGKFSPARLALIDKIIDLADKTGIRYFFKLWPAYKIFVHNHFIYTLFKIMNSKSSWIKNYTLNFQAVEGILKRDYLVTRSLKHDELADHFSGSNVILDLPYQGQTGYTHRLIQAIANGKKVITTNSNITKEDFYNSEQVQIIDCKNPELDTSWIRKKSVFPVSNCFSELELSEWLKSIINVGIV